MVLSTVALCLAVTTPALAKETGDLKIRFEYGGEPVAPSLITPNSDVQYCGQHDLVSEKLLVNPENKGIKNVVVYVYTGPGGSDLPNVAPKNETHVLTITQCRFDPHVVLAQAGDTLVVTNRDPVGHYAHFGFLRNAPQPIPIRPGGPNSYKLPLPEPGPIPVNCNIHSWMRAYVVVLEHPFAAKSDENGDLIIKGLPVGKELIFRVYHEAGHIDQVMIDGELKNWARSRFEVKIGPGMNDLGTVAIPDEALVTQ